MLTGGGQEATVGYLKRLDIPDFKPMAAPPKTDAWHEIVDAGRNPEENKLYEALEDAQGNLIQIATVRELVTAAQFRGHFELASTLQDRKNARKIPHMLEAIGFEVLRNPHAKSDGRWRLNDGKKDTLYVRKELSVAERMTLAKSKNVI